MSKTIEDRQVNREIKSMNRILEKDVYGNRFWARQLRKAKAEGIPFYQYELCDREHPERNKVIEGWFDFAEITIGKKIFKEMNDFIVTSNFWKEYRENNMH